VGSRAMRLVGWACGTNRWAASGGGGGGSAQGTAEDGGASAHEGRDGRLELRRFRHSDSNAICLILCIL
jgi:hypothetical protein